ncbi:DUF1801 domain-containing protein [Cryomorphaceae bacterium 1068]|nr:DUF1801 domain-containing protein [Cryomorphaceae bacterium 1068]
MTTPQEYIDQVAEDKKEALIKLRKTVKDHLPKGFHEEISYKMLGYVVPKSIYPDGYHCNTSLPLPFMNLAAQKNFIALYHMGIYADQDLMEWFTTEYPKHCKTKLDMGKSCIRFKKVNDIPYELIGQLVEKMTVEDWVGIYEGAVKK